MRQQEISRTAIEREIDRRGWADRQRVAFDLNVKGCGEAIQGPYWFGRAYEEPPEFTWSGASQKAVEGIPPFLTVGVSEWIRDNQGMYVGAYLWFKVKSPPGGCPPMAVYRIPENQDAAMYPEFVFDDLGPWERMYDPEDLVRLAPSWWGGEDRTFLFNRSGIYKVEFYVSAIVENTFSDWNEAVTYVEFYRDDSEAILPDYLYMKPVHAGPNVGPQSYAHLHTLYLNVRERDIGEGQNFVLNFDKTEFDYDLVTIRGGDDGCYVRFTRVSDAHDEMYDRNYLPGRQHCWEPDVITVEDLPDAAHIKPGDKVGLFDTYHLDWAYYANDQVRDCPYYLGGSLDLNHGSPVTVNGVFGNSFIHTRFCTDEPGMEFVAVDLYSNRHNLQTKQGLASVGQMVKRTIYCSEFFTCSQQTNAIGSGYLPVTAKLTPGMKWRTITTQSRTGPRQPSDYVRHHVAFWGPGLNTVVSSDVFDGDWSSLTTRMEGVVPAGAEYCLFYIEFGIELVNASDVFTLHQVEFEVGP